MWGLKKRFSQPFQHDEQAKSLRFSVSKGYGSIDYLESNGFKNLVFTARDTQNIGLLFKERVDIVIAPEFLIRNIVEDLGFSMNKVMKLREVVSLNKELCIAFSKRSDSHLVKRFRMAFRYLERSGELARLKRHWTIVER